MNSESWLPNCTQIWWVADAKQSTLPGLRYKPILHGNHLVSMVLYGCYLRGYKVMVDNDSRWSMQMVYIFWVVLVWTHYKCNFFSFQQRSRMVSILQPPCHILTSVQRIFQLASPGLMSVEWTTWRPPATNTYPSVSGVCVCVWGGGGEIRWLSHHPDL